MRDDNSGTLGRITGSGLVTPELRNQEIAQGRGRDVVAAARPHANRLVRWSFVVAGTGFVGIGAVGVFLPGIPTVGPLLLACWLFSKSCPHLEQRLIRNQFFAPFHGYLDGTEALPLKARIVAILGMWASIAISGTALHYGGSPAWAIAVLAALGVIGTIFILRFRATA